MAPRLRQVSETLAPSQTYFAIADTGRVKINMSAAQLFAAAIFGGMIIAGYGHCATVGVSKLVHWFDEKTIEPDTIGTAALSYSLVFSGAFAGIVATGADLFTSNVMYVTAFLLTHRRDSAKLSVWANIITAFTVSYLGNAIGGSLLGAMVFSVGGDYMGPYQGTAGEYDLEISYNDHINHAHNLICEMAHSKITLKHPIYSMICNGIGCNFFVALATWKTKYAQNAIGQYFGALLPVVAFCVGGFQHVIANMYTLAAAYYLNCEGLYIKDIIVRNILPVTLGNVLGGVIVAILGYAMHGSGDSQFGTACEVYTVQHFNEDDKKSHRPFGHGREESTPSTNNSPATAARSS